MAYVYLHTKPNGEIFYVGKGSGERAWRKAQRSDSWKNVVNKYGYKISIFLDNVSDEKAFSVERDLIEAIGLDNLTNITKGAGGVSGRTPWNKGVPMSDEQKRKLSDICKGRKFSKETRIKLSKANKGKKFSKEARENMSKAQKGIKPSKEARLKMAEAKKVKVIDTITGLKYDSVSDYCEKNNVSKTTFHYHFNGLTKKNKFEHIKRL